MVESGVISPITKTDSFPLVSSNVNYISMGITSITIRFYILKTK